MTKIRDKCFKTSSAFNSFALNYLKIKKGFIENLYARKYNVINKLYLGFFLNRYYIFPYKLIKKKKIKKT